MKISDFENNPKVEDSFLCIRCTTFKQFSTLLEKSKEEGYVFNGTGDGIWEHDKGYGIYLYYYKRKHKCVFWGNTYNRKDESILINYSQFSKEEYVDYEIF